MRQLLRELRCIHPVFWMFVGVLVAVGGAELFAVLHFVRKFW